MSTANTANSKLCLMPRINTTENIAYVRALGLSLYSVCYPYKFLKMKYTVKNIVSGFIYYKQTKLYFVSFKCTVNQEIIFDILISLKHW